MVSCRFSILGSRFWPNSSGSPADVAKEPLPPRTVVQCAVASTPDDTGFGVSEPVGVPAPPGSCCFHLDELAAILLRLYESVKRYVTPLTIVVRLYCHNLFDTVDDSHLARWNAVGGITSLPQF
jgi:hypothetical protein